MTNERNLLGERDRLRHTGTVVEKALLHSAEVDGAPKGAEARLYDALTEDGMRGTLQIDAASRRREPRSLWLALGGFAACAAGLALWSATKRPPRVAPVEPNLEAESLPAPAPEPVLDSALANCANPIVAVGSNPLIDDFEDGNASIAPNEGRSGAWMIYNDGTGKETPAHGAIWHPVPIPGGRGTSRYALHTWGGVFKNWGITGGFGLATPRCYDASAYDGVKFWAKGPGRIVFTAKMTQVVAVEDGGTCRDNCYDVHRKAIALGKRWSAYTIKWTELAQQGQGQPIPFDPRSLHAMGFFVYAEDTPFDFWIDDVTFVPTT
jgi:hypothetical protein